MIHFIIPSIGRNTLQNTLKSVSGVNNSNSVVVFDGIEPTVNSSDKIITMKCDKMGVKNGNKAGMAGMVRNKALDFLSVNSHKNDWIAFVDDDDTVDPRVYSLLHTKYRPFDFIIFNMRRRNRILPGNGKIRLGNVGISFAFKANLLKHKKYRFVNNHAEDFLLIKTMLQNKLKHRISDEVGYFVRNSDQYSVKNKKPIVKKPIVKTIVKKPIVKKPNKKTTNKKKPNKKTAKNKPTKIIKDIKNVKNKKPTIFIRTLFKTRTRPN